MARCVQLNLSSEMKARLVHGGRVGLGKRKERRPIAIKRPMHVTLHTSYRLASHRRFLIQLLKEESKRSKVRIYEQSLNSNHLHLATLSATRQGFKRFLSVISGRIAQRVTGSRKGQPLEKKFWDHIPFSRIVEWGVALRQLIAYIRQNQSEAFGIIPYTPRKKRRESS
jgi:REP element-mobilizing transposase RayT